MCAHMPLWYSACDCSTFLGLEFVLGARDDMFEYFKALLSL